MNYFRTSLIVSLFLGLAVSRGEEDSFTFNGFTGAGLILSGYATVSPGGLLMLTNSTAITDGRAFYSFPLRLKPPSSPPPNATALSFSTTFVFAINSEYPDVSAWGLTFALSPTPRPPGGPSAYMGLFNYTNNGKPSNHIVAVELDTLQNPEVNDIDDNHVGIDVDGMVSANAQPAGYYPDADGVFHNLSLISGDPMQVWIDYNGTKRQLNVTLAPTDLAKPQRPLLSSSIDLSDIIVDPMYVGFSAAEGKVRTNHCILGWSFSIGGDAPPLKIWSLPSLPKKSNTGSKSNSLAIWLPISLVVLFSIMIAVVAYLIRRRIKYAEVLEDWEQEYGTHRFKYKDLYIATDGFKEKGLLGSGGFGGVYRGTLPASGTEVAVKRVSHDSRQGMREFVAEVVSLGQLRHRNLVRLLGYCRRKGELLLVYDYMPNGSLDKYLHSDEKLAGLDWGRRFQVIKGVAAGLLYLHEDWDKVVIHRDIKASNVLLDGEFNGRLGDFGLARLYEHGSDPRTTHVVGTMGYLAPELARAGKATASTDVYAFGMFLLEVACGRRPLEPRAAQTDELLLLDWVLERWQEGKILETRDRRMGDEWEAAEVELVLKLGLLCCHPLPALRPSMRQVVQFLDGDVPLPELSPASMSAEILAMLEEQGFDNYMVSYSSSAAWTSAGSTSLLSGGR